MSIYDKLLQIQERMDGFIKDGTNTSDKYKYVSSEQVLSVLRPLLTEYKLLLVPHVVGHALTEGATKSGTTRYMTELDLRMEWRDCESGETVEHQFYAQGVDLAGEKGVGKALTYAEKYYIMKLFHVPTNNDDPDSDGRTATGEKPQKRTQASKENDELLRKSVIQMVEYFSEGDAGKVATIVHYYTKNDKSGYAGVATPAEITAAALPVVYSNMKAEYRRRTGNDFVYQEA